MLFFFLLISFLMPFSLRGFEVDIEDQKDVSPLVKDTLTVIYPDGNINLDPHQISNVLDVQFHTAIYEGLVTIDPRTLEAVPALSERWEISDGGKRYTFYLREGMMFSDGTPLDAHSFHRSFLRLLDPNIPKEYVYLLDGVKNVLRYRVKKQGSLSDLGVKVISPTVFEITLEYPVPYFLSLLAHHVFVPISSYQLPLMWGDYTRIAYSGCYIISEISENNVILKQNPFYWDQDSVKIKHLNIIKSDDIKKNTQDFLNEKADWVLGAFNPKSITGSSKILVSSSFETQFYYFADQNPIFQDMRVREALFFLIPWNEIYSLQKTPAHGLIPFLPQSLGYQKNKGFKTDRSKALKLLKKAGYPNGRGLPELVVVTNSIYEKTAKLIASSWLGLETNVRVHVPEGDYFEYLKDATPTLALHGWIADYLDPMAFLTLFVSTNHLNKSVYSDKRYDNLLFKSNLHKGKSRIRILLEAENLLLNQCVLVPISHPSSKSLVNLAILKGWRNSPLNIHPFKYFAFKENTIAPNSISWSTSQDEEFFFTS